MILDIGARVGKGNKRLDHFQIPKLELMHGVVPSVIDSGAVIQWSADRTEHAHITEIKVPGRSGNNQDHNPQICRWLDRSEKHQNFSLALQLHVSDTDPSASTLDDEELFKDADNTDQPNDLSLATPVPDLFSRAAQLAASVSRLTPLPLRTFSTETTAFHLNRRPDLKPLTIDEVAIKFNIPDLRAAIADYLKRAQELQSSRFKIGQRQLSRADADLPFTHLRIWYSARVQARSTDSTDASIPIKVCAEPPSSEWQFGRFDTVLLSDGTTPRRGLYGTISLSLQHPQTLTSFQGFDLAQIRLIFHPVWPINTFLAYAERFDVIPQPTHLGGSTRARCPDPVTGMYVVKRSSRSNGARMGGVVPLSQTQIAAPLVPKYGPQADPKLTPRNSLEFSTEFFLNHYFDKELYYFLNDL